MRLGIDASSQLELDALGASYSYEGKPIDPWVFMVDHNGCSLMRIRVWVDPYDEDGNPYGAGTNDLQKAIILAKRALKDGYSLLLDFHYSDFWTDPAKQRIPKSWKNLTSVEAFAKQVYDYTKETLLVLKQEGIPLEAVQVGNEITKGLLWPYGYIAEKKEERTPEQYDACSKILKQGVLAVREIYPDSKVVIHLERSGDKELYDEWLTEMDKRELDFDILGLSYYPYWHGAVEDVEANIANINAKFHRPIWIVEHSYAFTVEPYPRSNGECNNVVTEQIAEDLISKIPFPMTKKGQAAFFADLIKRMAALGVEMIVYWEPFWIPVEGVKWASVPAMRYLGAPIKSEDNEVANQCLFDYEGAGLPSLETFKV